MRVWRTLGAFAVLALLAGQLVTANVPTPGLAPTMDAALGPAYHVAVDSQGNVITGTRTADDAAVVSKYASDGSLLWQRTFDSGTFAPAVAVDSHDDVLAAPYGAGVLRKYTPDGDFVWDATIPGSSPTVADIFVDPTDGVWIAGHVWTTATGLVAKVASNGVGSWSRNLPMSVPAAYVGATATPDGGVAVTSQFGTVKYDKDGGQQWVSPSGGRGVAADAAGSVYVVYDYLTKLSSSGSLVWSIPDAGNKVRMDARGEVVVLHGYVLGVGPTTQTYANIVELSAYQPADGRWTWGFKHVSSVGAADNNAFDLAVRPGYLAFSTSATDSALYSGSWLAAACDGAADPPSLARACAFTPV